MLTVPRIDLLLQLPSTLEELSIPRREPCKDLGGSSPKVSTDIPSGARTSSATNYWITRVTYSPACSIRSLRSLTAVIAAPPQPQIEPSASLRRCAKQNDPIVTGRRSMFQCVQISWSRSGSPNQGQRTCPAHLSSHIQLVSEVPGLRIRRSLLLRGIDGKTPRRDEIDPLRSRFIRGRWADAPYRRRA